MPKPAADRLTREKIARAALEIADSEGFAAVSMRRIASRLGASTMSLYYYVRTKADLVALMDDALMGEALVPEGQLPREWREALTEIARRTRDVFTRHPWALLSLQGAPPGTNAMRHFEQSLEAAEQAPLGLEGKLALLQLVDDFVFGHSLRTAETRASLGGDSDLTQLFETGAFPRTAALFASANSRDAAQHRQWLMEDRFESGLAAILDGATRMLLTPTRSSRAASLKCHTPRARSPRSR